MSENRKKQEALDYHSKGRPGKIEVIPTKRYHSQRDLSLAYSPGVAEPCLAIAKDKELAYKYTAKGNLVAVISNGTAVLGLGDIGPEASKPVMEGKGLLFKIFADIDVFDIEVDAKDPEKFIETVKAIAPTFGGINLEDIKAPESFIIEKRLKEELNIPVMHDDQHGTAIISAAALLNALELTKKKIEKVKVVVNGAGAAAISCAKLYVSLGVLKENIVMLDSKGVLKPSRQDLDENKAFFSNDVKADSLAEAVKGVDVFLGLSTGGVLTKEMIKSMGKNPIVFALANPDPEISYEEAITSRPDVIVATGRSDNPNQVNNVLGFPYIFRGALDVRARGINEEMKLAAVRAIADLAKEAVPEEVNEAYSEKNLSYGRDFIIPKPLDPRLLTAVAPAVAKAAVESGIAGHVIEDWDAYRNELIERLGLENKLLRQMTSRAKKDPKKVVFPEGHNFKILKAASILQDEGIAKPVVLGDKKTVVELAKEHKLDLKGIEIIDFRNDESRKDRYRYAELYYDKRKRKGLSLDEAKSRLRQPDFFGSMMVDTGDADAMVSGTLQNYPDALRSPFKVFNPDDETLFAGLNIIITNSGPIFFADTTVNIEPSTEQLVRITEMAADFVKSQGMEPRIAMISYSNYGASQHKNAKKVSKAVEILHKTRPDLIVDGEIQVDVAMNQELLREKFPFSPLGENRPNTFIFPNLDAGTVAYKMVKRMSKYEVIGPVLLGVRKSIHIILQGSSVRDIVNMTTIAVADAQVKQKL